MSKILLPLYAQVERSLHAMTPTRIRTLLEQAWDPSNRSRSVNAAVVAIGSTYVFYQLWNISGQTKRKQEFARSKNFVIHAENTRSKRDARVAVNGLFFSRLSKIFQIIMPSYHCKEAHYLVYLTFFLVARTFLSLVMSETTGQNGQYMVQRRWTDFKFGILKFIAVAIPAAYVNSSIKYNSSMLSLLFRRRLSTHVHDKYLKGVNFYKASHLGGANRIDNADQRVAADIYNFCEEICELYTSLFKPILDLILFTYNLSLTIGWSGPGGLYLYFFLSAMIKDKIMPPYGKLTAKQSELEGNFRTAHQRLITNAEEIAFYNGAFKEKYIINRLFDDMFSHTAFVLHLKRVVGVVDSYLVKYGASVCGYFVLAVPIFSGWHGNNEKTTGELTRDYIRNTQLMGALSGAIGNLIMVANNITQIAGYTSRVSELLEMVKQLEDVGMKPFEIREEDDVTLAQQHVEFSTDQLEKLVSESEAQKKEMADFILSWRHRCDEIHQKFLSATTARVAAQSGGGKFMLGDHIKFTDVDLVSPDGKLLVQGLNFAVHSGENVMVTGPNGSGKSSLFRVLGELWPLHSGTLVKPRAEDILFVPQRPYLVLGTLRDQIIYPHSKEDMAKRGVSDDDLRHLLHIVDPNDIITSSWKFDEVRDWLHTFSGGQKQRVAMARLFYHRPKYAILDECTSAVSDEVEGKIYTTANQLGVTLFTVSHRPQLRRYHDKQLRLDGRTGYEFETIIDKMDTSKLIV